jgi:hypothetical protein
MLLEVFIGRTSSSGSGKYFLSAIGGKTILLEIKNEQKRCNTQQVILCSLFRIFDFSALSCCDKD